MEKIIKVGLTLIIGIVAVAGVILFTGFGKTENLHSAGNETAFLPKTAVDDITAISVDGVGIGKKFFDKQKAALAKTNPTWDNKTLDKEAFKLLRKDAVAQAEAQRRGIQVSEEEARNFTNQQRQMVEQTPKTSEAYKAFETDMQTLGFTDANKYWAYLEQQYRVILRTVKLREQIGQETGVTAYSDIWQAYDTALGKLENKAKVVFYDKTLEASINS